MSPRPIQTAGGFCLMSALEPLRTFKATLKFSRSVRRLGGSVQHDGCIEGQAYQAIFRPLHHGGHQYPALEADVDVGASTEVRGATTHRAAFGDIVQCEAARRSVDQQL